MTDAASDHHGTFRPSPGAATVDTEEADEGRLYPALHFLRVFAAISIFTGHWSEPYTTQLWAQGQIAIDAFFMIEGFLSMRLLAESDGRTPVGKLILARFGQVYPVYAFGLLVGAASFAPQAFAGEMGWSIGDWLYALVAGLLLWPTFSTLVHGSVFPLNPPTWAIVLELIGFVMLAASQYRRSISRLVVIWAAAVAAFMVLAVVWHDPNAGWAVLHYWGGMPRMVLSFFGGAILFSVYGRVEAFVPRLSPVWIGLLFFAMHLPAIRFIGWPLLLIGIPVLIALAVSCKRPEWSLPAGVWAARNALMIYVLGYPVMMFWRDALPVDGGAATPVGIALDFLLVFGSLVIVASALDLVWSRLIRPAHGHEHGRPAEQL